MIRTKAPPNQNLEMTTSVVLKYGGSRNSFGISPRCPVGRFYEVVEKGFGIKITRIVYYLDKFCTKPVEIDDKEKWLLEDYHIEDGHTIEVFGEQVREFNPEEAIAGINVTIEWAVDDEVIKFPYRVATHCTAEGFRNQIRLTIRDVLPDTIDLTYKGRKLLSHLKGKLIADFGVKDGDVIQMTGKFFPLSLFGDQYDFAQTLGVNIASECVICMEARPTKAYDCGHVSVCQTCFDKYAQPIAKCPFCQKK